MIKTALFKFPPLLVFIFLFTAAYCTEDESRSYHSTSADILDNKIIEAFNASPKDTKKVYLYALDMVQLGTDRHSSTGDKWVKKARKLITLSCFNETQNYLNDKNYGEAYIWCERGLDQGSNQGTISNYNVASFYAGLLEMKTVLESELKNTGEMLPQARLNHEINDTSKIRREVNNPSVQPSRSDTVEKENSIKLVEGPVQDRYGNIMVKVNIAGKGEATIRYFQDKGWGCMMYGRTPEQYYKSWLECAKSLSGN